ncbi:MAG: hypothetical protein JXQ73_06310 [Phycisphaerae bacterium]|nr:hypothetical protein [Phycisphaerae bacterium]
MQPIRSSSIYATRRELYHDGMRGVLLSLVLVAASVGARGPAAESSSVVLVDKGTPRAVLLLPRDAHPDEELAARELQVHIKKMSGASLGIAEGEPPADRLPVRIGASLALETVGRLRDRSEDPSAFCLSVRPEGVSLAGNSPEGTAVPKSPTLALPVANRSSRPAPFASARSTPWPSRSPTRN